jgi:hypothetical protein
LSNTLADFADDDVAGRFPVVQEIKALTREIAATYEEPNPTPQPPKGGAPAPPTSPLDALKQLQNLRSNITKWEKKLQAATTPDQQAKARQKLEAFAALKNTLEAYLAEHK